MANDTAQPSQTFIPRTVSAVEQGMGALVARFADPVRELGNRTLGFVDRLLGSRLLAEVGTPMFRQNPSVGGGGHLLYASPWYRTPSSRPQQRHDVSFATSTDLSEGERPLLEGEPSGEAPGLTAGLEFVSPGAAVGARGEQAVAPSPVSSLSARAPTVAEQVVVAPTATRRRRGRAAETASPTETPNTAERSGTSAESAAAPSAPAALVDQAQRLASAVVTARATESARLAAATALSSAPVAMSGEFAPGPMVGKLAEVGPVDTLAASGVAASATLPAATAGGADAPPVRLVATTSKSGASQEALIAAALQSASRESVGSPAPASPPVASGLASTSQVGGRSQVAADVRVREAIQRFAATEFARTDAGMPAALSMSVDIGASPVLAASIGSPFGRSLAHAAWVDHRLAQRSGVPAFDVNVSSSPRSMGEGYVFLSPTAEPRLGTGSPALRTAGPLPLTEFAGLLGNEQQKSSRALVAADGSVTVQVTQSPSDQVHVATSDPFVAQQSMLPGAASAAASLSAAAALSAGVAGSPEATSPSIAAADSPQRLTTSTRDIAAADAEALRDPLAYPGALAADGESASVRAVAAEASAAAITGVAAAQGLPARAAASLPGRSAAISVEFAAHLGAGGASPGSFAASPSDTTSSSFFVPSSSARFGSESGRRGWSPESLVYVAAAATGSRDSSSAAFGSSALRVDDARGPIARGARIVEFVDALVGTRAAHDVRVLPIDLGFGPGVAPSAVTGIGAALPGRPYGGGAVATGLSPFEPAAALSGRSEPLRTSPTGIALPVSEMRRSTSTLSSAERVASELAFVQSSAREQRSHASVTLPRPGMASSVDRVLLEERDLASGGVAASPGAAAPSLLGDARWASGEIPATMRPAATSFGGGAPYQAASDASAPNDRGVASSLFSAVGVEAGRATTPMSAMFRPGAAGARSEQLAGRIGVRAAGLSVDFIEPGQVAATLAAAAREGGFATAASMPTSGLLGGGAADWVYPSLVAGGAALRRAARRRPSVDLLGEEGDAAIGNRASSAALVSEAGAALARETAASRRVDSTATAASSTPASSGFASLAGTSLAGTSLAGTSLAGTSLAGTSLAGAPVTGSSVIGTSLAGVATPAAQAPWSRSPAATEELVRHLERVWSLARVFPASAQSSLLAALSDVGGDALSLPLVAGSRAAVAGAGRSTSVAGRAWAGGGSASVDTSLPLEGMAPSASGRIGSSIGGPDAAFALPAASPIHNAAFAAGGVSAGGSARPATVGASDRILLPDGRMPRGSFTWSRAASPSTLGEWAPSPTYTAAGVDAGTAARQWGESAPLSNSYAAPSSSDGGGVASSWDGITAGDAASEFQPGFVGPADPARGGMARQFPQFAAPRGAATVVGERPLLVPHAGGARAATSPRATASATGVSTALRSLTGIDQPLLQLVAAAAEPSRPSPAATTASQFSLLQPPPVIPGAPSSESSARMVDAMRLQQQGGQSDERVTLADLTLVATASAAQRLAASQAPASTTSGSGGGGSSSGKGASKASEKLSPEAERLMIDQLAREVLEEVQRLREIARERSGDSWQS